MRPTAVGARDVHEVDRRVDLRRDRDGARPCRSPRTAGGRDRAWPRGPVSPARSCAAMPASSSARSSPWTSSRMPASAAPRSSPRQERLIDAEVVDQEALAARHAQVRDAPAGPRPGRACCAVMTAGQADIDRGIPRGPVEPLPRRPASSEPWTPSLMPVPGLLNASSVVVPPNAAATVSWKNRSGSSSVAIRVWVWTSMTPGRTSSPVASMTRAAASAGMAASTAAIRPSRTATSAGSEPSARTTVPPARAGRTPGRHGCPPT